MQLQRRTHLTRGLTFVHLAKHPTAKHLLQTNAVALQYLVIAGFIGVAACTDTSRC